MKLDEFAFGYSKNGWLTAKILIMHFLKKKC